MGRVRGADAQARGAPRHADRHLVTRLRLTLQGEHVFEAGNGATFTPSAEVGVRHDGGDAETGTGLEVGAGARYTAGALTIEGQVRTLVAHEDSGYKEWGASGAIRTAGKACRTEAKARSHPGRNSKRTRIEAATAS